MDKQTGKSIPFATVYLLKEQKGSYTDEKGIFTLNLSIPQDTLMISCVGYQTATMLVASTTTQLATIKLTPVNYELQTVEVLPDGKKIERFDIGFFGKRPKTTLRWFHGIGDQIAVYVQNLTEKRGIIETINFTTVKEDEKTHEYRNTNMNIRLKLWAYDIYTKLPGKNLLIEDVIVHIDKVKRKNYQINISAQNIEFPAEGLFVGIEFLGVPNKDAALQFDIGPGIACAKVPNPKSYLKGFGYRIWKDTSVEYKSQVVPKMGLTLIEIE